VIKICPPTASAITSSRGMHGLPAQVAVAFGDLAVVDADADLDGPLRIGSVVLLHGALDAGSGTYGCAEDENE
jgi:hypothetical protein